MNLLRQLKFLMKKIEEKYSQISNNHEDRSVLDFLMSLGEERLYHYLEIASGRGRFPLIIKNRFPNFDITCLEINHNLTKITSDFGLKTIEKNILNNEFISESFDIIHASHIIEHFKYPDVALFLDELFRLVKKNGYIIIRSPLMHNRFYHDIDHVRPYPPESIFSYFLNDQQQKVGRHNIKVIKKWYRKSEIFIENAPLMSFLLKFLWVIFRFPKSRPNGYVLILQKL